VLACRGYVRPRARPAIGWTLDAVILLAAGVTLTFGRWWTYFMIPWSNILHHHRERSFFWGYGHMLIFSSIVATGAGLHVAQYYLEGHSQLGTTSALLTVVVPFAIFTGMLYLMYAVSMRAADPFHLILLAGTAAVLLAVVGQPRTVSRLEPGGGRPGSGGHDHRLRGDRLPTRGRSRVQTSRLRWLVSCIGWRSALQPRTRGGLFRDWFIRPPAFVGSERSRGRLLAATGGASALIVT
jgi:Bacterial low temperature requirement A protein (LtrA)